MTSYKSIVNIGGYKFTINDNGNFGLDTTNPSQKLDVNGRIKGDNLSIGTDLVYTDGTNVGIGTTNPNEKLHVAGNVNVNDGILLYDSLNNAFIANKYVLDNVTNGGFSFGITSQGSVYLNKPIGQTLNILTNGSSGVLVASDDSVGIGLFPTEKLDVGGNIKLSGNLLVGATPTSGTSGQVLVSKGSSSPEWETLVTGGGSSDKINMEVRGVTLRKKQIIYDSSTTIAVADIVARLDNPPDYTQVYTFGESIVNRWVAVGYGGSHTLAYSSDGINWTGLGKSIFSSQANYVDWSGSLWVAVGFQTNSLAYSYDGINWTGRGTGIFSVGGETVKWNGSLWVAGGVGTSNTLAYSSDGINWTGLQKNIFSFCCFDLAWNGSMWVAAGQGGNVLAYSSDGINWTGLGATLSFHHTQGIAWNGSMWIAVGQGGPNTMAYSYDGINWTGLGSGIFGFRGVAIAWNGILWVAAGISTNTLAYSYDGINWVGIGTSVFSSEGLGLNWNGTLWWASGSGGPNTMAYSYDGIHWIGLGKTIFSGWGFHAAFNNRRPHTITFSPGSTSNGTVSISGGSITLNGTTLDIVADSYYNNGHTNFSAKIL